MIRKGTLLAILGVVALVSGCVTHAQQGAAIGGLGGAGVGRIIGDATGHKTGGTLIGAAVGGLTGAAIGNSMDKQDAQFAAAVAQQNSGAVGTADVVAMVQGGVSEEVIATHIRTNGVQHRVQPGDLITLRNQGVSDYLINAMQTAHVGGPAVVAQPVYAQPGAVVVQEPVPIYYGPRPYWHRPYYPPPQPSFSFQYSSRRR